MDNLTTFPAIDNLLDQIPVGIALYDASGQCIKANPAIAEIVGATLEQILSQNYNDIASWKESGMYALAKEALKTKKTCRDDFNIKTTFGKELSIDITFTPLIDNDKSTLLITISDITERKSIEAELVRAKETHSKVEEIVHIGNWDWNILNGNLKWTDEIFRIFGRRPQEFEATYDAFLETIHPDDRQSVIDAVNESVADAQTPYSIEHRLIHPDGNIRTVYEQGKVYRNNDGEPIRMIGTVHDITERKATENELELYRKDLEIIIEQRTRELNNAQEELVRKERLATLGQLTATVSHELRNPLGAMRPSLYILQKKSDLSDDKIFNAIERIDRNITRCDHIIDELLDFTRISDLDCSAIDIDHWLSSIIKEHKIHPEIKLSYNPGINDIKVTFDQERLRRAVVNILDNGVQSMLDETGSVPKAENSTLSIYTQINNNRAEIIIKDTGSGISEEVLPRIFEPLFSTKGFGVGLGMPVVKQILEQHSGDVELSTCKDGTQVTLWLPLNHQAGR
ncbi:MAG: PAS domain-containing protein [Gammaproteobacteria bacterium]|nr:PAS domain-containing protein [Gammaproteobacteria bacterium]MCW9005217.1 PAS domain-containing protein [Gammaproteobacteria bacterium]